MEQAQEEHIRFEMIGILTNLIHQSYNSIKKEDDEVCLIANERVMDLLLNAKKRLS